MKKQILHFSLFIFIISFLFYYPVTVLADLSESSSNVMKNKESFWKKNFRMSGELRQESAFRLKDPHRFSKIRQFVKMDFRFKFDKHWKLNIGGRAWYDAAYDATSIYPQPVKDNLRKEIVLRDAYLDFLSSKLNFRLGYQQIVWGEALGNFFADVINPKDLREFNLPSFEDIRIPLLALDLQYHFLPSSTLEIVVSPDQHVDKLAPQGADFAFFIPPPPVGVDAILLEDQKPKTNFRNWNAGAKISTITHGWDLAGFYYTSHALEPTLFKTVGVDLKTGRTQITLSPEHRRVHHIGFTFSKDLGGSLIARGEFVYTKGKYFNGQNILINQGVEKRDQLRYVLGLDAALGKLSMNTELQQQLIYGSTTNLADQKVLTNLFFRFSSGFFEEKLSTELIYILGIDSHDMQISPIIRYQPLRSLSFSLGADLFYGPQESLYGQFSHASRVYLNTKWKF
ncbi:MAG: DUF1302 family protein [Deltaproteobacteria bacterium]|nr:DUF1302 family protein [Deltaproteobacteria bacterium]